MKWIHPLKKFPTVWLMWGGGSTICCSVVNMYSFNLSMKFEKEITKNTMEGSKTCCSVANMHSFNFQRVKPQQTDGVM